MTDGPGRLHCASFLKGKCRRSLCSFHLPMELKRITVLSYVGDLITKRGSLWILNTTDIRTDPVAVVQIPGWIPAGVHGSWIDDKVLFG